MSFEIKEKDLLARVGKLKTKSGIVQTPLFFPVVNPILQCISPREIREEFGFEAIIANAYTLRKHFTNAPIEKGLHRFLDYDGVIMTDSGAYQILVYGNVNVDPSEIIDYQEQIGSDIATILDIPTGWEVSEKNAEITVNETLRRGKEFFRLRTREDIAWVGPVQGGRHLNLVARSAEEMGKLPFEVHALGSPTEVMERYRFDVLVDMIMTAKMNLPIERPLHLFGAGHPFMFALAAALGCDLFDSAAYALYARESRYMTETGTSRLNELDYFPCACPKCSKMTPKKAQELPEKQKQTFLASHNLYACKAELERVKQAISDGKLWEHLEMRAHAHPALFQAFKRLAIYRDFIEKHDRSIKDSGLFFFDSTGLMRPEVVHYRKNLTERYSKPVQARILLFAPQSQTKPFHKSREFRTIAKLLNRLSEEERSKIQVCFYVAPFGVVPLELDETYPLSQHETVFPLDRETVESVADQASDYVSRMDFDRIVFINDAEKWDKIVLVKVKRACLKIGMKFRHVGFEGKLGKRALSNLARTLDETSSE